MRFYIVFSFIILVFHIVLFLNGVNLVFDLSPGGVTSMALTLMLPLAPIGLNIFSGEFSKKFLQAIYYLAFHFYVAFSIGGIDLWLFKIPGWSFSLGLGFTQKLAEYFGFPLTVFLPLLALIGLFNLIFAWGED